VSAARTPSLLEHPGLLWAGFILAHVWVITVAVLVVPGALGDVSGVYRYWVENAQNGSFIVGINTVWVYPILALAPIMLAAIAGINNYVMTWLIMVTIGDLIAFFYLVRGFKSPAPRAWAAWWWTGAVIALGPIVLGRLDSVTTPLAVWAILFVVTRPKFAGVLMACGAWIKVWPGAILLAALLLVRARWRILVAFLVASAAIIAIALVAGAGLNVFSFFGYQSSRGLQIESPAATPFLWLASAHAGDIKVYFDNDLLTYQVSGQGVDLVATAMTGVMLAALAASVAVIALVARRRIAPVAYLPAATLTLVMALIAFNKVGSPQYIAWIIPPIVAGLVLDRERFALLAIFALLLALLTQVIYPWMYSDVVDTRPIGLLVLSVRNIGELALWVWALVLVIRPRSRVGGLAARQLQHSR